MAIQKARYGVEDSTAAAGAAAAAAAAEAPPPGAADADAAAASDAGIEDAPPDEAGTVMAASPGAVDKEEDAADPADADAAEAEALDAAAPPPSISLSVSISPPPAAPRETCIWRCTVPLMRGSLSPIPQVEKKTVGREGGATPLLFPSHSIVLGSKKILNLA